LIPELNDELNNTLNDAQSIIDQMNNISNLVSNIKTYAENDSIQLSKISQSLSSQTQEFSRFINQEIRLSSPSLIFRLFINHLSDIINKCNSVIGSLS